jgi:outer membrane cobalamin receptor
MSFTKSISVGVLALAVLHPGPGEAQTAARSSATEPSLDEITVSATKIATPLLDVAATVTVIYDQGSERRIDRDIKDLVRYDAVKPQARAVARR